MRALSNRQASRCETAKNKTCRCRCSGVLHGINRPELAISKGEKPDPNFFETLPENDPHHVRNQEEKKRRAAARRTAEKAREQGLLWAIFEEQA